MHSFSFCPNAGCLYHQHAPKERWFVALGHYHTRCFGEVPRYRCKACRRLFSPQTFSIDYFAKRKINYPHLERLLSSSMSQRALARHFHASLGTVSNRIGRLSRQAIAMHAKLRPLAVSSEPVCIDGFVSFDRSQYFPNNITISITARSRFILSLTHATLRRSGRRTEAQLLRQQLLYRAATFERHAIERSFSDLLDELSRHHHSPFIALRLLITDEKLEYARALKRHPHRDHFRHHTVNSKRPRTILNPLFSSNYLDRELRKDLADHRRETACFARNVANMLQRLVVYTGWHNYVKAFRVGGGEGSGLSHARVAGIEQQSIDRERRILIHQRAFLTRLSLSALEEKLWVRGFVTPLKRRPEYIPGYALH